MKLFGIGRKKPEIGKVYTWEEIKQFIPEYLTEYDFPATENGLGYEAIPISQIQENINQKKKEKGNNPRNEFINEQSRNGWLRGIDQNISKKYGNYQKYKELNGKFER